jgi:hypothetical protein
MRSRVGLTQPRGGSHPKVTEKTRIRRIASQKLGNETPAMATDVATTSTTELRRSAAMIPAGRPIVSATTSAATVRLSVTGARWRIASMTGWFVRMDRPSSPWTAREPCQVLHRKGTIEAQLVPKHRHRRRVGLLAEHDAHRVPGREVDQGEHDDAHDTEDRGDRTGTAEEVAEHATASAQPAHAVQGNGARAQPGRGAAGHTDERRRLTARARPAPRSTPVT